MTDEDVRKFLQAVSELGMANQKGVARGEEVMQRMGWDPSDLLLGNPQSAVARHHADLYRDLAKHCERLGYVTKKADRYAKVAITPKGERYIV